MLLRTIQMLVLTTFCSGLFLVSCKKSGPEPLCETVTEIKGHNHLADPGILASQHEFADTLAKYPQLQVTRAIIDSIVYIMHCNTFYKDLPDFTGHYMLVKNTRDHEITSSGEILDTVNISLNPSLSYTEAVTIARQRENYHQSCLFYRLGIYNLHAGDGTNLKDYKLVWNITGDSGYPTVFLDAQNGKVYYSFDGIFE